MTAEWCRDVVQQGVNQYGKPQIVNTDQGSQFSSEIFTGYLIANEIKISMDGKGRAIDNIFIERLWKSVKYEYIYLKVPQDGVELYAGLKEYFCFYNRKRPHQSLDYKTPEMMLKKVA